MNIVDAAKTLKKGTKISRKSWGSAEYAIVSQYGFLQFGEDQVALRAILIEELLADDWEIWEEHNPEMEKAWEEIKGRLEKSHAYRLASDGKILFDLTWNAAQKHFTEK